jgi:hypothetical protein
MTSKYLFRSQVNELIRVILKSGIDPTLFEFDKDLSDNDLQIEIPLSLLLKNSPFYFQIIHFWGDFQSTYFPKMEKEMGRGGRAYSAWQDLVEEFELWLERVKEEITEPKPWLLLNQGNILTDELPTGDRGRENFSREELDKLQEHIKAVREFLISEVKPSEEEIRIINEKLDFLEKAALRQNKQDWAHTAIGVTFTIAVGLAMAPDQANKLFVMMSEFLKFITLQLLQ